MAICRTVNGSFVIVHHAGGDGGSHRCFICLVFAVKTRQEFPWTTSEKNLPLERLLLRLGKRLGIRAHWRLAIFTLFLGGVRGHGGGGATDGGSCSRERETNRARVGALRGFPTEQKRCQRSDQIGIEASSRHGRMRFSAREKV